MSRIEHHEQDHKQVSPGVRERAVRRVLDTEGQQFVALAGGDVDRGFWGRRSEWRRTVLQTHADDDFGEFLRAGAARVQVPVTPGFEDRVKHYMETGEVYGGNDMPAMGDPHYVAFINDRSSASGAPGQEEHWPLGAPSEWDAVQPTEFVILRVAAKPGLPAWGRDTGDPV